MVWYVWLYLMDVVSLVKTRVNKQVGRSLNEVCYLIFFCAIVLYTQVYFQLIAKLV
jgi:hypothetical protein